MRKASPASTSIQTLALLCALTWALSPASGQGRVADAPPENATAREHSSGWDCNRGYRLSEGICTLVERPGNAHLTGDRYGRGWQVRARFSSGARAVWWSKCRCTPIWILQAINGSVIAAIATSTAIVSRFRSRRVRI